MALILMPRDDRILALCGEYGVVESRLIHRLFWPDSVVRVMQKRLKKLCDAALLSVVELDVSRRDHTGGVQPRLYALTPQGAAVLEHRTGIIAPRVQTKECAPATYFHRRECVAIRYIWDEACKAGGLRTTEWIMEQDTRDDVPKDAAPNEHRRLYHAYKSDGRTTTCRPDLVSLTQLPTAGAEVSQRPEELLIAWEVDLGTESHQQIRNKLPGYLHWLKRRSFDEYFSLHDPVVRIFWVCKTKRRMQELRSTLASSSIAAGFRFGCFEMLRPDTVFHSPTWFTTTDGPFRLLR